MRMLRIWMTKESESVEQSATDLEEDHILLLLVGRSNIVIICIIVNIAFRTYSGIVWVIGARG